MPGDRDVLLVVDRAHRATIDEVRLEFDPLAYKVPPHITLVYPDEGQKVFAANVSRTASQLFRMVLRFDRIQVVGERNVWLMADEESARYVDGFRKDLIEGKCNARIVLGRGKDRAEAEKIRDHAVQKLRLPCVIEFSEVLHEEILADGSSRAIGKFPLRQDQLVFQATRAAKWLWNAWPFGGATPLDVSRTAYRLLTHLVPMDEDSMRESSWNGVRLPDEPLSRFDMREVVAAGNRALAVLRWDAKEKKRFVEVHAHSLPSSAKLKDAEPLVAAIQQEFSDTGHAAVKLFLWGDRRGDEKPGDLWHFDSLETMGPIPDELLYDVPPGLELRRETTVEFLEDYRQLYHEHRQAHPNVAEFADADMMRQNLSSGGVLTLRDNGEMIGLVGWQLGTQPQWDLTCHLVDDVIVTGNRRWRGFGKVLRAVAAKAMEKRSSEFQAGRIRAYNVAALSGALENGRSIVATEIWVDASERQGWRKYSLDG
ncbi:MAG: 2'-5' RNA ligase family protein [Planctomycetes bacterium]|nr:2'-5' RNA ligase family protein [Planctomycetota bacterium]